MLSREALELNLNRVVDIEDERRSNSIGVALVIVGIDPSKNGENATDPTIWTVIEKKTKPQTEKVAGQISFPGETRKIGEKLTPNIVGALSEFSRDNFDISHNLFFMRKSSYVPEKVSIRGNFVDLMVLMCVGSQTNFEPVDQDDVMPHKWMTINEIREVIALQPEKVRKFARDIVRLETSDQLIARAVDDYFHDPIKRVPASVLLPRTFSSIEQFHVAREMVSDIVVFNRSGDQNNK